MTKQLTQQLADAHWSIQQIFVQQTNLMTLINAAADQLSQGGDPIAALTTLAPLTKTLQTYTPTRIAAATQPTPSKPSSPRSYRNTPSA